ncbi:MAG: hypothetical protein LBU13_00010 [Synergistaceae bacterium]|nr:hypothetical protein [Synergistaceae bacterium]
MKANRNASSKGQLAVKILALVRYFAVRSGEIETCLMPVTAATLFLAVLARQFLDFAGSLTHKQRREECFQAEVEADAFTRSCFCRLNFLIRYEEKPKITQCVALYRESLYFTSDLP